MFSSFLLHLQLEVQARKLKEKPIIKIAIFANCLQAADLSRSLDGARGVLFTVGALLAGAPSPFTSRGSRLRLRIQK